ncbi:MULTISPECIES: MarR family transcriptional regulator [Acidithrix]|nr:MULTISPECIES: MarR family transcriptional regulator [Acidithrix]
MTNIANQESLDAGEELVDAVLAASRALVAVAARSLATVDEEVTLVQYRVLVELAARGPQNLAELATALGVSPSTATRMCDRLVRKGLIERRRTNTDRRIVRVSLASPGRKIVTEVTRKRRTELEVILARLPLVDRQTVLVALRAFADAAGTVAEKKWPLGWNVERDLLVADPTEE